MHIDSHVHSPGTCFICENAQLRAEVEELTQKLDLITTDRDQARKTAEHWKAEHLAGNAEVERLTTVMEVYRLEAFDLQAKLRTSDLQIQDMRKVIREHVVNYRGASVQTAFSDDAKARLAEIAKILVGIEAEMLAVVADKQKGA